MKKLLLGAVCGLLSLAAHAQFLPPSFPETDYPLAGTLPTPVLTTNNTSCYSLDIGWIGYTGSGLGLVSSWDDVASGAGIAWMLDIGGGYTDQGYLSYGAGSGISSVNVGIIFAGPTGIQVDVTFHKNGGGHYLAIYNWNAPAVFGGPGTGLTLASITQLSNITTPTRISMDSHKGYGTGIVWEDPTNGVNILAGNNNNFGPLFNMNGTRFHIDPDVAFIHAGGPLDLHIASYNQRRFAIYEYYVNWNDIIPGGTLAGSCPPGPPFSLCSLPMTIEDVNPVAQSSYYDIHLDAPDHYNVPNWAYVYTNTKQIFNRIMNYNGGSISSGGVPGTITLTDGSYPLPPGLPPIDNNGNYRPVIAYDATTGPASYYIGWVTGHMDPAYNPSTRAYVAAQFREDGTIMNPSNPLLGVINFPASISKTPSIAFSKHNDQGNGLYSVYTTYNGTENLLTHKITPWSIGTFRPTSVAEENITNGEVSIFPNPFNAALQLNVSSVYSNDIIQLSISDIFGKVVAKNTGKATDLNIYLKNATPSLSAGTYIVNISIPEAKYVKTFKAVKAE
jgi:hypothetical protein